MHLDKTVLEQGARSSLANIALIGRFVACLATVVKQLSTDQIRSDQARTAG
jgi:hypothetical protein